MEYVKSETKHVKTAYSSLTISGISLVSALLNVFFLPFILSPIAIILSHLSKGRLKTKHVTAKASMLLAILAMIINCLLIGLNIYRFKYDAGYRAKLDQVTRMYYGVSLDEYMDEAMKNLGIAIQEAE